MPQTPKSPDGIGLPVEPPFLGETSRPAPLLPEGTAKEQMSVIIQDQPDDSSYEEILRELAFHRMVLRGLADVRDGAVMDDADFRRRLRSWQG